MSQPTDGLFGLDPGRLLDRAHFLAAYATQAGQAGWPAGPSLPQMLQRLSMNAPTDELIPFDVFTESTPPAPVEAADALRRAAMAALLVDPPLGRRYLMQAADRYRQAGLPFGLFLAAACDRSPEVAEAAARQFGQLVERPPGRREWPVRSALEEPVQQLYLLLTVATVGGPDVAGFVREMPSALAYGTDGPAGIPLGEWWQFATDLASAAHFDDFMRMRDHLVKVAHIHGTALRVMREDGFNWERANFRADLVDVVLVGIVCLLARRPDRFGELLRLLLDRLDGLDAVSVRAGLAVAAINGAGPG